MNKNPTAATEEQIIKKRYVPGPIVTVLLALLGLAAFVVYLQAEPLSDMGMLGGTLPKLILAGVYLLAGLIFGSWFLFRSSYHWLFKLGAFGLFVLFWVVFEIEADGDAFGGRLRYRFRQLAPIAAAGKSVDSAEAADPLAFSQYLGPDGSGKILRDLNGVPFTDEKAVHWERDWEKHPPKLLWKKGIGAGWAGFAAAHGTGVTLEQRGGDEVVSAYDLKSGEVVWTHVEKGVRHANPILGGEGPRSTPTIHAGKVYAVGGTGVVYCLQFSDGKLLWKQNLVELVKSDLASDFAIVNWGRSCSPLIYKNLVIVAGGGKTEADMASLIAFDSATGKEVWRGGKHQIGYASPVVMKFNGADQIVIQNEAMVSGHNPETGAEIWSYARPGQSNGPANNSQPRQFRQDFVLVSKGYGLGGELLKLNKEPDGKYTVQSMWKSNKVLTTKLTSAIVAGDVAFALSEGILECVELETGKRLWRKGRYGHGQVLLLEPDLLFVSSEDGELCLVEVSDQEGVELAKIPAISGVTWNNPCLYKNFLIVRNSQEVACFELPVVEGGNSTPK